MTNIASMATDMPDLLTKDAWRVMACGLPGMNEAPGRGPG